MNEPRMTLLQLHDTICRQIELLTDETTPYAARKSLADVSTVVSSLAKQVINNADVVLRAEKLVADGKLKNSGIEQLIGSDVGNAGKQICGHEK